MTSLALLSTVVGTLASVASRRAMLSGRSVGGQWEVSGRSWKACGRAIGGRWKVMEGRWKLLAPERRPLVALVHVERAEPPRLNERRERRRVEARLVRGVGPPGSRAA